MNIPQSEWKRAAARHAVGLIEPGMVVGLGHGSTVALAVHEMGDRLKRGELKDIVAIPCSEEIKSDASQLGIRLADFASHSSIDLTIDGADEVDPQLNLIKGGGGALLREKILAQASRREVIMVDESKLSAQLGEKWAVPIEVLPYGWELQKRFLESLGARVSVRLAGRSLMHTINGNMILDANFGPIMNPQLLAARMTGHAGLIEHGLFVGMATEVVVAGASGIQVLRASSLV